VRIGQCAGTNYPPKFQRHSLESLVLEICSFVKYRQTQTDSSVHRTAGSSERTADIYKQVLTSAAVTTATQLVQFSFAHEPIFNNVLTTNFQPSLQLNCNKSRRTRTHAHMANTISLQLNVNVTASHLGKHCKLHLRNHRLQLY